MTGHLDLPVNKYRGWAALIVGVIVIILFLGIYMIEA